MVLHLTITYNQANKLGLPAASSPPIVDCAVKSTPWMSVSPSILQEIFDRRRFNNLSQSAHCAVDFVTF